MIPRGYFDQLKSENEEKIKFALRALALMKTADNVLIRRIAVMLAKNVSVFSRANGY